MQNIDLKNFNLTQGVNIYGTYGSDSALAVSSAGDVNGDGCGDALIGVPNGGACGAGEVYLIFGSSNLTNVDLANLTLIQGIKIYSAISSQNVGFFISSAGDVNGDGYSDILIGADAANPLGRFRAGESYLIFGKKTGWQDINLNSLTLPIGIKIDGATNNSYSGVVSGAGDVNGDGYSDILIGAGDANPLGRFGAGESYLIFGKSMGWQNIDLSKLGSDGITIIGAAANDESGLSVSSAGDVNGDGYDDFIISAYGAGEIYLIFGKKSNWQDIDLANLEISQGIKVYGGKTYGGCGAFVSDAGDVDGNNYYDFLIGCPFATILGRNKAGITYLIFGKKTGWQNIDLKNLTVTQGITIYGAKDNDQIGHAISNAGDVNNDGYGDIVIGAEFADPFGRMNAGESYIIFGKATDWTNIDLANFTLTQGIKIYGASKGDQSGSSVSGAMNVNKNGYSDIIIGASGAAPLGRTNAGESYIIFGGIPSFQTLSPTQSPTFSTESPTKSSTLNPTIYPTESPIKSSTSSLIISPWMWELAIGVFSIISFVTLYYCMHKYCSKNNINVQNIGVNYGEVEGGMNTALIGPIGISLEENNDIEIIEFNNSSVAFNYNGTLLKTSWVGSKDAILVYDHNKNKVVDNGTKIVFTKWSKNAETDFEALLEVFDSNKDNIFDNQDNNFDKFYIWQDKNQNGVSDEGELISLQDAGIKSIDFNTQKEATEVMKSKGILNTAEVHWTSGLITKAYDLVFEHEA